MVQGEVKKHIEVKFIREGERLPETLEGELQAIEFRAPWVSVLFLDKTVIHLPVAQVRAIRITDQKENA